MTNSIWKHKSENEMKTKKLGQTIPIDLSHLKM